jgi:hypothetical protein
MDEASLCQEQNHHEAMKKKSGVLLFLKTFTRYASRKVFQKGRTRLFFMAS